MNKRQRKKVRTRLQQVLNNLHPRALFYISKPTRPQKFYFSKINDPAAWLSECEEKAMRNFLAAGKRVFDVQ